jgi:TonB family protein
VVIRLKQTAILVGTLMLGSYCTSALAAPARSGQAARPAARPASGNTVTAAAGNGPLNAAYNSYLNALRQRIDNQWYLADGNNHVTLTMTVSTDGSVTALEIASTPKNVEAEQTASDAFNKVQPLPGLPSGSNAIKMTLSFDSRASQHENERHLSGRIDSVSAATGSDGSTTTNSSSSSSSDTSTSTSDSSSSTSGGSAGNGSSSDSSSSSTSTSTSSGK